MPSSGSNTSAMNMDNSSKGEYGRLAKRSRSSQNPPPSLVNQWNSGDDESPMPSSQYNPLDEPSPLGLRLNKTQSLLELIEKRLSEENSASLTVKFSKNRNSRTQKDAKRSTTSGANDKLKASNFPASLLRIGSWQYVSSFQNGLVVKCYFAKQRLVWEVLEGGLKSKIEIMWSDIIALKANYGDNGPGTLTIVLARPPIFFKENNPQPRKHTIWKRTPDFTGGQASINRKHFLQCPPGVLNKHYQKLIQCDRHLYILSQQLEIIIDSPYFEACASINPEECRGREFDQVAAAQGYSPSSFQDVELAVITQSPPLIFGQNPNRVTVENMSTETLSSSSVMDTSATECNGNSEGHGYLEQRSWEQLKVPDLHPSVRMSDLENNIGSCISEQVTSGCVPSDKTPEFWDVMENIKRDLLGDTQSTTVLDEKSLLKKVDSLSFLLRDPATSSSAKVEKGNYDEGANCGINVAPNLSNDPLMREKTSNDIFVSQENCMSGFGCMPMAPSMLRIDSFADF
ncbi:unnamed protein product [Fraxinus pennsylvanica]|uniref:TRF2/HOY1 PH-like domain-containing protein n=1 Tax=Fraxinus pennsylvanica TaxID=56036 RepID=A0AAD1Z4C5_9LAMI|nr:unnamed protein product [Fraxinus pennsylvanica]